MLVLFHLDWFGQAEELQELDNIVKQACTETEGIEYKGRYTPNQRKFHWTYFFEADNFAKWEEAWVKTSKYPRDLKKLPHGEFEFFPGPFHE